MDEDLQDENAGPTQIGSTNGDPSMTTKPLRRACDCCRKRKVKCDGGEPCGPCKKASIRCAYLQPPKKKGPKGLRSARVLHALRRIDDNVSAGTPTSPLSPDAQGAFGNWGWTQANNHPVNGVSYSDSLAQRQHDIAYGPHTSVAPDQTYFSQMPTSMPPHQLTQQSLYQQDSFSGGWSGQSDTLSAGSDGQHMLSPTSSDIAFRIPGQSFMPYIRLFFNHMFPIMPVIDSNIYLDPAMYNDSAGWSKDLYCFLCSICAATIVQLDESIPQPPPIQPGRRSDHYFAEECLRERRGFDYIESGSTLSIMTSFFMFAYYGNHEKHAKAWHYLQEAITFAENMNMDDEASYGKLEPVQAQWRRRLYWLLFITERAYAVQSKKHTRLTPSVQLPAVFESEDPTLLNGFVNLANLFSAVDDNFVRAWRGSRKQSLCNEAWLARTQEQLDQAALALGNISETQHMDISVTREWLHILAWQMGVRNGLMWGKEEHGTGMRMEYPIELARKVVNITSGVNALALDSHGIGMEQKLCDIAGCVADVLRCTQGHPSPTFLEGKECLNILLQKLSSIRGKESRYLKPLMSKMEGLIGYEFDNEHLPLPTETPASYPPQVSPADFWMNATPRLSMADSVGMLRTLSMSGNLGMPSLSIPMEDWSQRRPSGKVYDEQETESQETGNMDSWYMSTGMAQAV